MNRGFRWGALALAAIVATAVGVLSYNAGVSHGLALNGNYRAWGWGGGWGFAPLFFLGFWFFMFCVFRGFFWGGMYHCSGYGPGWRARAFDEWHRRAHEEMNKPS